MKNCYTPVGVVGENIGIGVGGLDSRPGPVKWETVSSTALRRCDASSKLCRRATRYSFQRIIRRE